MKQRRSASIIMAASLLLLAGCQKDEVGPAGQGRLMLNLESFGNGSTKTVLGADDRSLQWLTGDQVCINGTDYAVTASGESAYVAGVPDAAVYKAVFPASMVAGRSMSGNTVTATLPRQYEYRTEGGLQVLDAPLAAVGDGSDGLTFRHLTGALTVVIENTTSNTLYIDTVYVSSAQQLCGDVTVNFDAITSISPNTEPSSATDTMVLLTVPYNTLSVAAGATVKVQVPVLPVSDANRFTVHVATRHEGTRYDFDRRQGSASNALGRNQMGYVPASIATSGSHITVKPLFEYDEETLSLDNELSIYIKSTLDFLLLSDATQNNWTVPTDGRPYSEAEWFNFVGTIDMEGYSIPTLRLLGNSILSVNGNNCQINNLTINGEAVFPTTYLDSWHFIQNITFNNLTINVPNGENYVAGLIPYFDSPDGWADHIVINGLTFNFHNGGAGRDIHIGGICETSVGNGWTSICGDCSVTDITVNVTGTPFSIIRLGGISPAASINKQDNYGIGVHRCSYTQNKPLNLTATNAIYYGGVTPYIYDMNDGITFNADGVEITHNASLSAPVVLAGGIAGYFNHDGIEGDVVWNNGTGTVTQRGTIDIYNASTALRADKKIATVLPSGNLGSDEANITCEGTGFNDDALTIIAH